MSCAESHFHTHARSSEQFAAGGGILLCAGEFKMLQFANE